MTTDTPYLFDARSASWPRTTGWERYTREIATRLPQVDDQVRVRLAGSPRLPSRLWQDAVATPAAVGRARVAHFPTMPPVPWARPRSVLVYTLHDLTWWLWRETASRMGRHYYAPLAERTARRGAHLVVDTHTVGREVIEHFGLDPSDVTVVPLGVELPTPAELPSRRKPYLLSVGTLEPRKNMTRLAEAYRRSGLAATHDLLVVGRLGWGELPAGLEIVSGLSDAQLAATYAGATALVMPSLYEGFGLPAVEAMQLGVPVICSGIDVLKEVTGDRATYVDATDLDCLVEALRAAPAARAPDGAADWARKTYRWDHAVERLSRLYRQLDPEVAT